MKAVCFRNLLILLAVFAAPFSFEAYAQQKALKITVKGEVIDTVTQKGVEFATIAFMTPEGQVVSMAAADGSGKFNISMKQAGDFKLSITSMGFSSHASNVKIETGREVVDLGKFYLRSGIDIKEITVSGQKPLITMDADKLTYSVETDPESQTSTVVDILRKIPQLSVDAEDNVLLNGQSNYKVLVNGKTSQLYSNNFKEVIRSMPANTIRDIEVITNPSTRYEAEGVGGIINIITTRRTVGYNGRIGMAAGTQKMLAPNLYAALQLGKFSISGTYAYYRGGEGRNSNFSDQENFNSDDRHYIHTEGARDIKNTLYQQHYANIEASYEIDSLNLITLSGWGYTGNNKQNSWSRTTIEDNNHDLFQSYLNEANSRNKYGGLSGSLDYQRLFKKPDQSLTVSYKLDRNPRKTESTNEYSDTYNFEPYRQYSWNDAKGTEHTAQVDYFDPINKKHQIEVGTKYILRRNVSDTEIKLWDFPTEEWVIDNSRLNDLDYDQHIWGIYGGYGFKNKGISTRAGVRAETNWNNGTAKTKDGDTEFKNTMFNVIPYVNFTYMFKKMQRISFSYTQRLQRPGIWYLNPYVDDTNPMSISYGNPDLDAVVSHTFSGNYSRNSQKWNLFVGANVSLANNSITSITKVNDQGISERTYENIGKDQNYRINASFGYRLGTKFTLNVSASANYFVSEAKSLGLKNDGFGYQAYGGVSVGLWKEATIRGNARYYHPSVSLQGSSSAQFMYGFGLTQNFLKRKFNVNLFISNPFTKDRTYSSTTEGPSFYRYSESQYMQRRFQVYVGYRFGKTDLKVKKARRTISNDDRMNGSGESGGASAASGTAQ